ncbi:MAG: hypothetical protein AT713_00845 [Caldivirga sp. JCHS_4]|jgi:hypothetical protein|nr:MAG: hypothetical protein AT713_00845 [Caldivirga sp. JCHS_4]
MSIRGSIKTISGKLGAMGSQLNGGSSISIKVDEASALSETRETIVIPLLNPSPIVLLYDEKDRMYKVA